MLALRIILYVVSFGLMIFGSINLLEREDKVEYLSIEANIHLINEKPAVTSVDVDMFEVEMSQ